MPHDRNELEEREGVAKRTKGVDGVAEFFSKDEDGRRFVFIGDRANPDRGEIHELVGKDVEASVLNVALLQLIDELVDLLPPGRRARARTVIEKNMARYVGARDVAPDTIGRRRKKR